MLRVRSRNCRNVFHPTLLDRPNSSYYAYKFVKTYDDKKRSVWYGAAAASGKRACIIRRRASVKMVFTYLIIPQWSNELGYGFIKNDDIEICIDEMTIQLCTSPLANTGLVYLHADRLRTRRYIHFTHHSDPSNSLNLSGLSDPSDHSNSCRTTSTPLAHKAKKISSAFPSG